jgi:tetratricopeptide (TPR) repeat protein
MRFADEWLRGALAALVVATASGCAVFTGPETPKAEKAPPPAASTKPQEPAKAANAASTANAAPAPAPAAPPAAAAPTPQAETSAPAETEPPVSVAVQRAFEAARQALITGRLDDAERGFLALTKSNPELGGPYANLGIVYRQRQKLEESVAALERAVQASPKQAVYFNQLGISYRMVGQFTKAKDAYEKAIALDPNYALAHLNLGILYDVYLWDGRRALELYDRYLALSPAGDDRVKKWATDLRNRNQPPRSLAVRKEQG